MTLVATFPVFEPAVRWTSRPRDGRHPQIAVLSALLALQIGWIDFGASAAQAAMTIAAALSTQWVAGRTIGLRWDWRSPLITGLSLSLLLRSHDPAVWAAAGLLGIGSKFLLRVGGKHLFNPACFAIVVLLLSGQAWVSPGQWGALAWSGLLLGGGAAVVLSRARRVDTAIAFLLCYACLLGIRCQVLGDPWSIPWHQLHSGALLIFACFMITDPRTTPDRRSGRIGFAVVVGILAYALQFHSQMREGLFFALALAAPLVPLIDRLTSNVPEPASCASVA